MKFRTNFSDPGLPSDHLEKVDSTVITRPDRALSVRDILDKYTRGEVLDLPDYKFGGYDGEFGDDELAPEFSDPVDYLNSLGIDLADAYQISMAFDEVIDSQRQAELLSSRDIDPEQLADPLSDPPQDSPNEKP